MGVMCVAPYPTPGAPAGQCALFAARIVNDERIFYCPTYDALPGFMTLEDGGWQAPNWNFTGVGYPYWMGYWLRESNAGLRAITAESDPKKDNGRRILTSDLVSSDNLSGLDAKWNGHLLHGKKAGGNFLYNDGSVLWRPADDLKVIFNHASTDFWL